mgnify:CR=1 FL=1
MNESLERIVIWLVIVNGLGFILMGVDKWKAKRGVWRISEKTLFLPALLGGTPGVIAGMRYFRHKTKQWQFSKGLPVLLALQLAVVWLSGKRMI